MKQKLLNSLRLQLCMLVALFTTAFAGQAWGETKTIKLDFEDQTIPAKLWDSSSFVVNADPVTSHSSFCASTGGKQSAYIQYKNIITKVKSISVEATRTSSNTNGTMTIEFSEDGKTWDKTQTVTISRNSWTATTLNLDNPADGYVKINFTGTSAIKYIDNIVITYEEGGSTPPTPSNPTISYGSHDHVSFKMWDNSLNDINEGDEVEEGTEVFVKATPENGYALQTITAVYGEDQELNLTENTGNYSFIMPSSNVTISATAVNDGSYVQPTSVTITFGNSLYGTSYNGSNAASTNKTTVNGSVENVNITASQGSASTFYVNDSETRIYGNGSVSIAAPQGYDIISIAFNDTPNSTSNWAVTASLGTLEKYTWTGNASSVVFTATGRSDFKKAIVTLAKQKSNSDLAKKSDIVLDFLNEDLMGDIADYIQTSSTGAFTYSGYDEDIIDVDNDGTFMGLATGSTTITVAQAADDNYKAGSVTINVTVKDTRVAATTIPAINITSLTENETGTISVVNPEKADEAVTFEFTSDNENVLLIDGTKYLAGEAGTVHVTVKAKALNSKLYKDVEAVFEVIVNASEKKENVIVAVFDSYSTVYGTALEGLVDGSTGFDGTITAVSSNEKVATVSVDAEGNVTVTPVAVGTTTITFSAAETGKFLAAADVQKTITVTAPEGKTVAPAGSEEEVVFSETFAKSTGTAGWSGNAANGTIQYDNKGWSDENGKGNDGSAKFGTSSAKGTATTPALGTAGNLVLTFKSGAWSGDKTEGALLLSIAEGSGTLSATTFNLKDSAWDEYEVTITGADADTQIKFSAAQASKNRFFLDDVKVIKPASTPTETVTLNAAGYATYSSENPIDFSVASDDFSAWQVTEIATDGTITLDRINVAVKGGVGVLLYGAPESTITLTLGDATEDLHSTNLLHGTLAPMYFEKDAIYGLSGSDFKHNNAGSIRANRAYLLDSDVEIDADVKNFRIVFHDEATGITSTREATADEVQAIFDLSGRRLQKLQRGINIVGGRKVVVK